MKRRISQIHPINLFALDSVLLTLSVIEFLSLSSLLFFSVCDFSIFLVHNLSLIFQLYVYFFKGNASLILIEILTVNLCVRVCVSHWRPVENFNKMANTFFSSSVNTHTNLYLHCVRDYAKYLRRLATKLSKLPFQFTFHTYPTHWHADRQFICSARYQIQWIHLIFERKISHENGILNT